MLSSSYNQFDIPRCRVYLFTFRRPQLLRRAIKSLVDQSFTGWVCELHNDDPDDRRPSEVLKEFSDPRITLVTHSQNLGPTRTFNCAFVPVSEEFISILEDDNSWDPEFLEQSIKCLDKRSDASLVWANMQLWKQVDDSTCIPSDVLFWPEFSTSGIKLSSTKTFFWSNERSLVGGLHSNGAMLLRTNSIENYVIPDECPFNFIEHVRERTFRYPIILIREKLANWTWTTSTSRPPDKAVATAVHVMLAGSFLLHCKRSHFGYLRIWIKARKRNQRHLIILVLAILLKPRLWSLLKYLKISDLAWLCVDLIKNPCATLQSLGHIRRLSNLRDFIDRKTKEQTQQIPCP